VRPIVKWIGGKAKLLPELRKHLPKRFGRYFEPFIGGGALFFDLEPAAAVIGDKNEQLVNLYRSIAYEPEGVEFFLSSLRGRLTEEDYYLARNTMNGGAAHTVETAALMVYLNKTCFNGLWRVNARGHMNAAWGHYTSPRFPTREEIHDMSHVLCRSTIVCGDFELALGGVRAGDLVYLDPPYVPASKTANYTGYTADGFSPSDQMRLVEVVRTLQARDAYVIVSNSDTEATRALYHGLEIHSVHRQGTVNCDGDKRAVVPELIVVAKPKSDALHDMFDVGAL
jgi:DNA adenine methylase